MAENQYGGRGPAPSTILETPPPQRIIGEKIVVVRRDPERYRCKLYRSANKSINNTTATAIDWDAEEFDAGGLHDTVTNNTRITIPTDGNTGVWLLSAAVLWEANNTGTRSVTIRKNGATAIATSVDAGAPDYQTITVLVNSPAAGDYFEVVVEQSSGGALLVTASDPFDSMFQAVHLP